MEEKEKLWSPVVDFTNTLGNFVTKLDDQTNMWVNMLQKHPDPPSGGRAEEGKLCKIRERRFFHTYMIVHDSSRIPTG